MYEEKDTSKKSKEKKAKNKFLFKKSKKKEQEEKKSTKKILAIKPDWVAILIKFAIFLVVAFIIIFVVTKVKMGSNKKSFADNMEKMKEVAYLYFKEENNRPYNIGGEVDLLLGDMIDGNLIKELQDTDGNVCSRDYSYASLVKNTETEYDLNIYLSCGGEAQSSTYTVTYGNTNNNETNNNVTVLYELTRTVTTTTGYTCPEGYLNSGRYCLSVNNTEILDAIPIYRVTPEKETKARYKSGSTEYEYTDPIVTITESSLNCSSGYTLENGKCVKETSVKYKTSASYTCPNGGTLSGTKCLFTTTTNYSERKAYCTKGTLVNGDECYVTKDYSLKCIVGKKDSSKNECYTTYTASKELSDWLLDGRVTYSENKDISKLESEKVRYEEVSYNETKGTITYKKYIKKYIYVCDDDDVLSGTTCKHYDSAYENRYCSSNYTLTADKSECYTYTNASYKKTSGTYTCPDGYSKKGSGENATCYKYEAATKTEDKTAYCPSGYDLTKDNRCVQTKEPTIKNEEEVYSCPEGYTQKGKGSSTVCYKKTTGEGYYYCTSSAATLNGTRCIIPATTTFIAYRCPSGYENSANKCIKTNKVERILATLETSETSSEETIWSKTKDLEGWTWTGKTKEE